MTSAVGRAQTLNELAQLKSPPESRRSSVSGNDLQSDGTAHCEAESGIIFAYKGGWLVISDVRMDVTHGPKLLTTASIFFPAGACRTTSASWKPLNSPGSSTFTICAVAATLMT